MQPEQDLTLPAERTPVRLMQDALALWLAEDDRRRALLMSIGKSRERTSGKEFRKVRRNRRR